MQPAVIPRSAGTVTIGTRANRCAVRVRSSCGGHSLNRGGCLVVRESRRAESNTPQWIPAPVVTPHCSSQSVKRSRSSVKVANTRTGFSSRPGGTATNISRAPTSIPAAFGSNTGRSSKHIPLFRLRRLGFASRACRLPPRVFFTGCSLSELQATAKLRNRRYSSKRNQLACPNC
jgi:hypothetical protein